MSAWKPTIRRGVIGTIKEIPEFKDVRVVYKSRLVEDLDMDGLDMFELVAGLEDMFKIKFAPRHFASYFNAEGRILDVRTLCEYVAEKIRIKRRRRT